MRQGALTAVLAVLVGLLAMVGCGGSSSNTMTAPSTTTRCSVALRADTPAVSASGGGGTLTVSTNRECTWEAASESEWLTLSGRTGQGDATLTYTAASNPQPAVRRGGLVVNGVRSEITQAAADCDLALASSVAAIGPEGGPVSVGVTGIAGCSWTTVSQAPWVRVASGGTGHGNGNGRVDLEVDVNDGEARTGTVTIAGRQFTVAQGAAPPVTAPVAGCTYNVPSTIAVAASGGAAAIPVVTTAACTWSAVADVDWVVVAPPVSRQGPASVVLTVAANTSTTARTGRVVVAGRVVLVAQDAAPLVAPPVTTPPPTSPPTPPPTTPTPPPAPPVAQCSFAVTPTSQSLAAVGGPAVFSVNAPAGCAWTASSATPWLPLVGPASGEGAGFVTLSAPPNPDAVPRTGTATVAGQVVQVTQAAASATPTPTPCTFDITPTTVAAGAEASNVVVAVTASSATCAWSAASPTPWLTAVPTSGTGNGAVSVAVAANAETAPRSGLVSVAGGSVQVTQAGASAPTAPPPAPPTPTPTTCTFSVSPTSHALPSTGGGRQVSVTASAGSCGWAATSSVAWISVITGASSSGNGVVDLQVATNDTGASRSGTVTVAGQAVTVTQEAAAPAACTYTVAPLAASVGAGGGNRQVTVAPSAQSCTWTAASTAPWLVVVNGAQGTGTGTVTVQASANEAPAARSGTLSVAGRTVTITQDAAAQTSCTFDVRPDTQRVEAGGGEGTVMVSASGASCSWVASSSASWLAITGGTPSTGNGMVTYRAARNESSGTRTGTLVVAGRTVTVTQDAAAPPPCQYALVPSTLAVDAAGGESSARLETAAACAWSVESQAGWITVVGPASGTGSTNVRVRVASNDSQAGRTGIVRVADKSLQITQAGAAPQQVSFDGRSGMVGGSCPHMQFRVMGQLIYTDGATRFEGAPCSALRNGSAVRGEGRRQQDGRVLATRVEITP